MKDLKPNGRHELVTEENKKEYISLISYEKMDREIEQQIQQFLAGLRDLIPSNLISIFSSRELELMIAGLPDIDSNYQKEQII